MVQLRLYLKELKDFLNTVTIKDEMLADSMLTTWVREEWQEVVAQNPQANPYYRALLGDYILFSYSDQLIQTIVDLYNGNKLFHHDVPALPEDQVRRIAIELLNVLFPIKTKLNFQDSVGNVYQREIPNSYLYQYCNEVPIISSYDESYKIPFAREFLFETQIGKELDLRIHSSTSVVYRIPNARYNTLISRYPQSSAIIHSIVYPIPLNLADETSKSTAQIHALKMKKIQEAPDMSLLVYDEKILEKQEQQSIVDCLIHTLDMIRRRYNVRELGYENLYAPAHYYLLWQILYLAVFVQRIQNIHTGDAHLYHIWSYLKSNGFEDYRDVLSVRQQKFLYKNLPYLIKHKGTEYIFEILDYVFFHTQNITLSGKNTIQMTEQEDVTTVDTTKKYPSMKSIQIGQATFNKIHKNTTSDTRFEDILHMLAETAGQPIFNDREEYEHGQDEALDSLFKKERAAGLEYQEDSLYDQSTTKQTKLLSYSPISRRNTKMLELKNNNTTDYLLALYTKFIGETILYRVSKNNLDFVAEIQLPDSSKKIELPVQDWIGLIFYALDRSSGNYDPSLVDGDGKHLTCNTDRCYHDRPPSVVYVSWPYDIEMEDYDIPETFLWHESVCHMAFHLATLTSTYVFGEEIYELSDSRQEISDIDRYWTCSTTNRTLRYNRSKNRWNIVDKDENVVCYSSRVYSTSVNLAELSWRNQTGELSTKMIPQTKKYLVDLHMPQYPNKIRSVDEFAECIHQQGLGFVIMNQAVNADESAINRAAYHAVMQHRCVGESMVDGAFRAVPIQLNLFNGKSYQEYLNQRSTMIDNLNLVLERYDVGGDSDILYSRMADAIIAALLPEDDPYLPMHAKTARYRYQKLIDLFKSMTAYNLAYIDMQYADIDSTKMSTDVSDYTGSYITSTITDIVNRPGSDFEFKTTSVVKQVVKPTYPDQMSYIIFKDTFSQDEAIDTSIKQTIIDNIDKILEIYDTRRISKSKKHTKLVNLLGEDIANIVESMSRDTLDAIKYAVDLISDTHVYSKIKPYFTEQIDESGDPDDYTESVVSHEVNDELYNLHRECETTVVYDMIPGSTVSEVVYNPNLQPNNP